MDKELATRFIKKMQSSILSVGTELTSGQITNRNATWISKQLKNLGLTTSLHMTVPDDRDLIYKSLEICSQHSDMIFVTGGLGPTTDDFTRNVVNDWAGTQLVWHEPTWLHIVHRLESRGLVVREMQKQQCYFPEGSDVLSNDQGTAAGFRLKAKGKTLIVLPGPPREIEAIWSAHIQYWLHELTKDIDPYLTKSWDTLGYGESDIAHRAEPALQGCPFEIGYRVHFPYVEVKISYPQSKASEAATWIQKLEAALGPVTAVRDGKEPAQELVSQLEKFKKIEIYDDVGGSFLLHRLNEVFSKILSTCEVKIQNAALPAPAPSSAETLILYIQEVDENQVRIGWIVPHKKREVLIESPLRSSLLQERKRQYFVEKALLFWNQELQDL